MSYNDKKTAVLDTGAPRGETVALPEPHPWRRFFARVTDMFIVSIISGMLLAVFPVPTAMQNPQLLGLLVIAAMVPYEAAVNAMGGTLPGKSLLAVRVERQDGGTLGFNVAFRRAMLVWVKGVGLGLPIISLITMLLSWYDLSTNKLSSWDRDCGCVVRYGELGPGRLLIIIALLGFFALLLLKALRIAAQA